MRRVGLRTVGGVVVRITNALIDPPDAAEIESRRGLAGGVTAGDHFGDGYRLRRSVSNTGEPPCDAVIEERSPRLRGQWASGQHGRIGGRALSAVHRILRQTIHARFRLDHESMRTETSRVVGS